jgi:hypothetical protein
VTRVTFAAGSSGDWLIESISAVRGEELPRARHLQRLEGEAFASSAQAVWLLNGVRSHERYVHRDERERLVAVQPPLERATADRAALIPIRKSTAWWALAQDERRGVFEAESRHISIGLEYLPAVARRLYHCRDLGEPFDFLTWFEYAEADTAAFDELVGRLRATREWDFVEREVEIRLRRV